MKTKINYTAVAVLALLWSFSSFFAVAQPNFSWVRQIGGTNEEDGWKITHDIQGNVYTAGTFYDTININTGTGNQVMVPSPLGGSAFITKTDADGNLVWAKAFDDIGTTGNTGVRPHGIITDAQGNLYVSGTAYDSADLNPDAGQYFLTTANYNGFFCKLNSAGNFVWAKVFPCSDFVGEFVLAADQQNFYLAGSFRGTIDLDPGTDTVNFSATMNDIFALKLDSIGNLQWAKRVGGNGDDLAYCIALDSQSNVYVGGSFEGTCDFHPGNQTVNLNASGLTDGFLLKLNSNGNYQMAKKLGGVNYDYLIGIAVGNDGNVYTTGSFADSADFQPGAGNYMLTSVDSYDGFVCKLDTAGALVWAKQLGGLGYNESNNIALDNAGNVYTTGVYYETIDFDVSTALHTFSINTNTGGSGAYLHAMDENGNYLWAKQIVCADNDVEFASFSIMGAAFYLTGDFTNTVDFDPGNGVESLIGVDDDVFILKWSSCNPSASTFTTTACNSYTWIDGNTYTGSTNSPTYTYTAQNGCDSVVTLDLTINTVDISITDNSPVLNANANNASYQWIDCGSVTPVINQTAQIFTATQNGSYAVQVTQNGCVDTSACVQITGVTVEEISAADLINIYPNPSNGNFVISITNDQKFSVVRIYDAVGHKQLESAITDHNFVLRELPRGTYMVELSNGEAAARKRVVVQ